MQYIPRFRSSWKQINRLNPVNWQHPLNRGLVGWWLVVPYLAGSFTLYDLCKKTNGTLTNMGTNDWVYSNLGNRVGGWGCLDFDGSNDFVDLGDNFGFERTDQFSIVLWQRGPTNPNSLRMLFSKHTGTVGYFFAIVGNVVNDPYRLELRSGSITEIQTTWARSNDTNWHQCATTYDGSGVGAGVFGYEDGLEKSVTIQQDDLGELTIQNAFNARISGRDTDLFNFTGRMDDIRIYNRVLSPDEIRSLYLESRRIQSSSLLNYRPRTTKYFVTGPVSHEGALDLSSTGTIVTNALRNVLSSNSLSMNSALGNTGTRDIDGNLILSIDNTITQDSIRNALGVQDLFAAISVNSSALRNALGTQEFSGAATLNQSAVRNSVGSLDLSELTTFISSAIRGAIGQLNLSGVVTLIADGVQAGGGTEHTGELALSIISTIVANGIRDAIANNSLSLSSTFSTGGFRGSVGTQNYSNSTNFSMSALRNSVASNLLSVITALGNTGLRDSDGNLILSPDAIITQNGLRNVVGEQNFNTIVNFITVAIRNAIANISLNSSGGIIFTTEGIAHTGLLSLSIATILLTDAIRNAVSSNSLNLSGNFDIIGARGSIGSAGLTLSSALLHDGIRDGLGNLVLDQEVDLSQSGLRNLLSSLSLSGSVDFSLDGIEGITLGDLLKYIDLINYISQRQNKNLYINKSDSGDLYIVRNKIDTSYIHKLDTKDLNIEKINELINYIVRK